MVSFITIVFLNSDKIEIFSDDKSSTSVRGFVDSCLETTTERSLEIIGSNGGWIYPPSFITKYAKTDINSNIYSKQLSKDSQGVDFFGEKTPYWYYYDDSSEKFKFQIPPYDDKDVDYSIINQMQKFIEENIERECLNGLIVFDDLYDTNYNLNDIKVEVEFTENKIFTYLTLPIEIVEINTNAYEYIEDFNYETQNKIYLPYLLARDVVKSQSKNSFLEHRVIDFMYPNQQTDTRDNLPPFYDFDLTYDFEPWRVDNVEKRVKEIIDSNIHLVQDINTNYRKNDIPKGLENSNFANSVLNELYTKDYLSENSQLLEDGQDRIFRKFSQMELNFDYDIFYPMSFRIDPSIGNTIVMPNPQSFLGLIPLFMTQYSSTYEITTPIFVEIRHRDYPNFEFRFPIEINIDHNTPLRENYELDIDLDLLSGGNSLLSQQLTCNPAQFISKPVKLNISDPIANGLRTHPSDSKTGVKGAIVQFTCKQFQTCPIITNTPINGEYVKDNITQLEFNLPIDCFPGTLEIIKYGHKTIKIDNLDPNLESEINLGEIEMPSSKNLLLEVRKKDPSLLVGSGNTLNVGEIGFVIFENLDEENFVSVIELDASSNEQLSINLMPGRYSVKGFIIDEVGSTIPQERKSFDTGPFSSDKKVTLPQINLSSWVSAGIEIDELVIDNFDIMTSSRVTVYLVEYGTPKSYDDLEEMSNDMGAMKQISQRADFKPDFN